MSELESKISEWLDKSGYPLELFALQRLLNRGYFCTKSDLYKDAVSGAPREIDLIGDIGDNESESPLQLRLLIECKKSDKPFVILANNHEPSDRISHMLGHGNDYSDAMMPSVRLFFRMMDKSKEIPEGPLKAFKQAEPEGYSIVKAFTGSDSDIYGGVLGLAAAEDHYILEYQKLIQSIKSGKFPDDEIFMLIFPILLVDAPLFMAFLDSDGSTKIEPTGWGNLVIRKPWGIENEKLPVFRSFKRVILTMFLTISRLFLNLQLKRAFAMEMDHKATPACSPVAACRLTLRSTGDAVQVGCYSQFQRRAPLTLR